MTEKQVLVIAGERALRLVYTKKTIGSCVDLGRAWISSAMGLIIVPSHGVILRVFIYERLIRMSGTQ